MPVDLRPELNNATPSLQPHYRAFVTTTGCSAPVPRIGTLALAGITRLDVSLHIGATGSRVPQGGPLSPLLSNLVLDELDRELERRGHRFVRYADDCVPRSGTY